MRSEPSETTPINRLDELMLRTGINNAQLSRLLGCGRAWVQKLRTSEKNIPVAFAKKAAPWLSCAWSDFYEPVGAPIAESAPLTVRGEIARRVRAVRRAWWDSLEEASAALGVPIDRLAEVEAGILALDESLTIRLCEVCRVPADFLLRGVQEPAPVPAAVRARIAQFAPDLVPALVPLGAALAHAA